MYPATERGTHWLEGTLALEHVKVRPGASCLNYSRAGRLETVIIISRACIIMSSRVEPRNLRL
jgi:hypothetical protein